MSPGAVVRRALSDQRVAYVLVGGLNTVVGLGLFVVLYLLCEHVLHYLGALAAAYALALPLGFVLQRRYVFRVNGPPGADVLRYATVQSGAFALNVLVLPALVELVGAPVLPAQVVSLGLVVCASYVLHGAFTFRRA